MSQTAPNRRMRRPWISGAAIQFHDIGSAPSTGSMAVCMDAMRRVRRATKNPVTGLQMG